MRNNFGKLLVTFFVCLLINVKSVQSYGTFGLDMHHRYSDKVKDFLDLNGLPEKGTMDYYHAMAHRDHLFKARRLAGSNGSSSASIITFLGGNDTFQLQRLGFLHYSVISVGTPPLKFLVALDTGSDLFWLPCDCTNCPRSLNSSTGTPTPLEIYSPSTSSTSSPVPCNSTLCGPTYGCATRRNACAYRVDYVSANTSSTGILVDDILYMGTDESPQKTINAPITLGCGIIQTGDFLDGAGFNGLFGLGMDSLSVPSVLASKGLIGANSLSMCISPDGFGRIEFGYKGGPGLATTPFIVDRLNPSYNVSVTQTTVGRDVTNLAFTAIFDTGTSFAYLTDPAYSVIVQSFDSQVSEPRYRPPTPIIFDYCYELSATQNSYGVPDLNFTMAGGAVFFVTAPTIVFRAGGGLIYCLAITKSEDVSLIGQNFMTGYRMVFDREEMVLGWEEAVCSDSITSTNTPGNRNSTNSSPPPPPRTTFGNRTRSTPVSPPSPPPPSPTPLARVPLFVSNASKLGSISTNILMAMISLSFHHFIVFDF